jgi:tRNA (guanine10-N2)-dimethyltransferase
VKLLFELSKEHPSIPGSEVISTLKAEDLIFDIISSNEDAIVVNTSTHYRDIKILAERLSYTFVIDELLFFCPPSLDQIEKHAQQNLINRKGSIAITCKNRSKSIDSQSILKKLAEIYTVDKQVNLNNPDLEIRILITDTNVYVGIKIAEIIRSNFEKRKVQHRPFFSPISLHPKLARALVNLSLIKKDETLLDPFCGTGGILLEAGLIGARAIGSDIEKKMIVGCQKTLEHYKIKNYTLIHSDIGQIFNQISKVDAVVTDLPYGKSTTTKGENIKNLYNRAFEKIAQLLKNNSLAVIGSPDIDIYSIGKKYFSILEKHEFRVHRSLTRYFAVFQV